MSTHTCGVLCLGVCLLGAPRAATALPDLTVTAVSGTPAALVAGKSFTLSNTVRASGGAAGRFTVGLYLSTDSTITTGDTLIGSRTVASLASGASSAASTTVILPASVAVGTYYVGALADSVKAVAESNENNNGRVDATRLTVSAAPDLSVTSVAGAPARIGVGDGFTATDTVAASASGGAAGAFTVGYYLAPSGTALRSGTLIGSRAVASLAAGASSSASTALTIPSMAAGTYAFGAVADSGNAVDESNENDNALSGGTVVVGGYSCQHPASPIDDGNPCTVDVCDPVTGVTHAPASASTACNDGNACTYSDHCDEAGRCTGTAVSCVAAGPCQAVQCDGSSTCSVSLKAAGSACGAANTCGQVCDGVSPNCQPAE